MSSRGVARLELTAGGLFAHPEAGVAQAAQGNLFDLTNALRRQVELGTDVGQRLGLTIHEAVAQQQDAPLPGGKPIDGLAQVFADGEALGPDHRIVVVVLDHHEVAEHRSVFADRALEAHGVLDGERLLDVDFAETALLGELGARWHHGPVRPAGGS